MRIPSVALLALLALTAFAAAGCGAKDPTGSLTSLNYATPISGHVQVTYQAFAGSNPAGMLPSPANGTLECAQDNAPSNPSGQPPHCKQPYTLVKATFNGLPDPGTGTYHLVFVGADGKSVRELAAVSAGSGGYAGNATAMANVTQDLSGQYAAVELRLGDFRYATAPAAAGGHDFALVPGVNGLQVQGTFKGHALDLMVSGLQGNVTYMGKLYVRGPDGSAVADEDFPVSGNGHLQYQAKKSLADFVEFHIHVGDGKLNLFKSSVQVDA